MSEKIKTVTTITLPEGITLSAEQLASIQNIVDGKVVVPSIPVVVKPDPVPDIPVVKLKDCGRGPSPKKITGSGKLWDVQWDGDGVYELDWFFEAAKGGKVLGKGRIKPTVEMKAHLALNLDTAPTLGSDYVVRLVGVTCKGEGKLEFTVPKKGAGVGITIKSIELANK